MSTISWARRCAARSVAFTSALISIVAVTGERHASSVTKGGERRVRGRPVVNEGRGLGAVGGDGIHPAAFVEPRDLTLRHDDGRDRGGVERLVLARVINRSGQ